MSMVRVIVTVWVIYLTTLEFRMVAYHNANTPPPVVESAIEELRLLRERVRSLEVKGSDIPGGG